jgi:hypothetical protein
MKVAESIPICVDLKNLWIAISSAPALDASAVTIPINHQLSTLNSSAATPQRLHYSKTRISGFLKRTVKRKTFFSSD